jgi:hypothetical protein
VKFYLGVHRPNWLEQTDVPLFVSHMTLRRYKSLPRALGKWALDSGGFSQVAFHGSYTCTATDYARAVRSYRDEIGGLQWAAIQDWMCEPFVLAKTGLTLQDHRVRTVFSLVHLRMLAPDVLWMPVLQGWHLDDYLRCRDAYSRAGVDLTRERVVGLGSVCRRQHAGEAEAIIRRLQSEGLRLHGFGFKTLGLQKVSSALESSDSMAWSLNARRNAPMEGCSHRNCANCLKFALAWREGVLRAIQRGESRSAPARNAQTRTPRRPNGDGSTQTRGRLRVSTATNRAQAHALAEDSR